MKNTKTVLVALACMAFVTLLSSRAVAGWDLCGLSHWDEYFSLNDGDFSASINVNPDDTYSTHLFLRLASGKDYNDDDDYPTLFGDEKFRVRIRDVVTDEIETVDVTCQLLATNDVAAKGQLVRCDLTDTAPAEGKTADEITAGLQGDESKVYFKRNTLSMFNCYSKELGFMISNGISFDFDGDGIPDMIAGAEYDNCIDEYNPDQADADDNGIGDACEEEEEEEEVVEEVDTDGDGVADVDDECPNEIGTAEGLGCPPGVADIGPDTGLPAETDVGGPSWATGEEGCSLIAR